MNDETPFILKRIYSHINSWESATKQLRSICGGPGSVKETVHEMGGPLASGRARKALGRIFGFSSTKGYVCKTNSQRDKEATNVRDPERFQSAELGNEKEHQLRRTEY